MGSHNLVGIMAGNQDGEQITLFHDAKRQKVQQVCDFFDQLESYKEATTRKQRIVHQIYLENVEVTELCIAYQNNIRLVQNFEEMDQQVQLLIARHVQFNEKLDRAKLLVSNAIIKMMEYMVSLENALNATHDSKNMEALEKVCVPPFNWADDIPDPKVDELDAEWKEANLKSQILNHLDHIQERVLFENGNHMNGNADDGRRM